LALVQRRGAELGGEAAELGRLAGQQEAVLRALVSSAPPPLFAGPARSPQSAEAVEPEKAEKAEAAHVQRSWPPSRAPGAWRSRWSRSAADPPAPSPAPRVDLRTLLDPKAGPDVTIAAPATPVLFPPPVAAEITAAVAAALDNVTRHAGPDARAWLLLEELDDTVTVSIRDNGPGIPDGRLAEAERAGRLGVAQSIRGRIRDLGGTVVVTSIPGSGTEIELHIPH
jgi:signal transduction histidine kinase